MLTKPFVLLALLPAFLAAQTPTAYEKGLTDALNLHDKASATFYKGLGEATKSAGSDPDALFQKSIPVYEAYETATDKLFDALLDLSPPAPLKKIHKALLISKLRLLDGLSNQIAAFKSNDPGRMEAAYKGLNATLAASVVELRKQVEAGGFDFERFTKDNVLVKKG